MTNEPPRNPSANEEPTNGADIPHLREHTVTHIHKIDDLDAVFHDTTVDSRVGEDGVIEDTTTRHRHIHKGFLLHPDRFMGESQQGIPMHSQSSDGSIPGDEICTCTSRLHGWFHDGKENRFLSGYDGIGDGNGGGECRLCRETRQTITLVGSILVGALIVGLYRGL